MDLKHKNTTSRAYQETHSPYHQQKTKHGFIFFKELKLGYF